MPTRSSTRFEVILTDDESLPPISIRKNGKRCDSLYGVPTELALFIRATHDPTWLVTEHLLTYLKQNRNTYPLIFESEEGRVELRWDSSLTYDTKTELNVTGNQVEISARSLLHGKIQERTRSFMGLIVNGETRTLSPLKNISGWEPYNQLANAMEADHATRDKEILELGSRSLFSWQRPFVHQSSIATYTKIDHSPLQVSLEQFHALHFTIPLNQPNAMLENLIFKVNGQEVTLNRPTPSHVASSSRYRLTILDTVEESRETQSQVSQCTLRAECRLGEQNARTSHPIFQFFAVLERARDLHPAFKAQKRKAMLHEAFFRVVGMRKQSEVEGVLKDSLPSTEFGQYTVKAEAKRLLKQVHTAFTAPDGQIAYFNDEWQLMPNNKAQEALLYAIPFALFGSQLFRGMQHHDEMHLPRPVLDANLPELHAKLQEAGIELFFHHKPIVSSRWEFSMDAQHPPHIDWFEIRPEIKCDGVPVDEATWGELLQRSSIMETDRDVRILDVNSMEILRSLSAIYPSEENDLNDRDNREDS